VTHRRFFSATGLRRLLNEEHFLILNWENSPLSGGEEKTGGDEAQVDGAPSTESFHVLARSYG
jgi:hypothetical protein